MIFRWTAEARGQPRERGSAPQVLESGACEPSVVEDVCEP